MFVMSLLIDFQVKENSKAGTVIGKISVVDPDNKLKERVIRRQPCQFKLRI